MISPKPGTQRLFFSQAAAARAKRRIIAWFHQQSWKPFPFQLQTWNACLNGSSGLIHATTGTGKTLAAWFGPVIEAIAENEWSPESHPPPLRVLWITPLRALAQDTVRALRQPLDDLRVPWTIESRTGDSSAETRRRQRQQLPSTLVTTPESLSLLLTRPDAEFQLRELRLVVCDEWHELLSTKRGVQVELALARLRRWQPHLKTWGLSATLGNIDEAMRVLLGKPHGEVVCGNSLSGVQATGNNSKPGRLIRGCVRRKVVIDSLIPQSLDRFPWAGHLGMTLLPGVIQRVDTAKSSLIFTNTRSQTETWYQALLRQRPDWAGQIALHHGSLDQQQRGWVENALREGTLKCVVCTSSLDLGVDFSQVDQVVQIGSPKGIARLLQRAGRSGHSPGAVSQVTCVPTHALELIEFAAAREAVRSGSIEHRQPVVLPLDVLCQHLVTIAIGTGFRQDELLNEVRQTAAYSGLRETEWQWMLDFAARGGPSLQAYPDYQKLAIEADEYTVSNPETTRRHRMSIGTIVADAALVVQYLNGGRIGVVEEAFVARLKPGDCFVISGRCVELVRVNEMTVWVRRAPDSARALVPRWMGGRMPLSTELSEAVQRQLQQAADGKFRGPEMQAVRPILELQAKWSAIPVPGRLLIERLRSREGHHVLFYPFAGRLVHEGLATLFAWRMSRRHPITFSMSVNDYGFELLSQQEPPLQEALAEGLLEVGSLAAEILDCCNAAELGKRQFREIARVSGLVFQGYPGSRRTMRQLQASSGLLYDVFSNYDPENLLLLQSQQEVLERQLELSRLVQTLNRLRSGELQLQQPPRFTPLAFPLLVDRMRERLSSETLAQRVARMQISLEKEASRIPAGRL